MSPDLQGDIRAISQFKIKDKKKRFLRSCGKIVFIINWIGCDYTTGVNVISVVKSAVGMILK